VFPVKDNIPARSFPLVTLGLILANVVAYVLAIRHGGSLISGPDLREVYKYGVIPDALAHHLFAGNHARALNPLAPWETVFTAMFMHASILHIAGNMLFLWIFGNTVEDALGHLKFLLFYLLAGVAATALQVAIDASSTAPMLGASGAIAGVLGAYIVLYPRAGVLTLVVIVLFVTVIEVPASVMIGVWFVEQAIFAATHLTNPTGAGSGVAYFAHVGGFVFGLLTIRLLVRSREPVPA
jgi:membrane associated rhomboid family serine protease